MLSFIVAPIIAHSLGTLRPPPSCFIHHANFRPSENGLAELGLPLKVMPAVVRIELLDDQDHVIEQCSATSVSRQGHLISAAHCFERCMDGAGLYSKDQGISLLNRKKLAETKCRLRVNGQFAEVELLAASDCKNEESRDGTRCPHYDYVLMRLRNKVLSACLPLSQSYPEFGTKVASVGFPIRTYRKQWRSDAQDSNGKEQFVSVGQTIPATNSCYKQVDRGSDERAGWRSFDPKDSKEPLDGVRSRDLIQTNGADEVERSSGGPLVSVPSGEIIGIAGFGLGQNHQSRYTECEGATFFIATGPIVQAIKRNYPAVDINEVLKCESSDSVPK